MARAAPGPGSALCTVRDLPDAEFFAPLKPREAWRAGLTR
jgi:hypothetical protein